MNFLEILFISFQAFKVIYNLIFILLLSTQLNKYIAQIEDKNARNTIISLRLRQIYTITIMILSIIFYHFYLPYYYIIYLHGSVPVQDTDNFKLVFYTT